MYKWKTNKSAIVYNQKPFGPPPPPGRLLRRGAVFRCNRVGQPARRDRASPPHRCGWTDAPGHLRGLVHGLDLARTGRPRQRHAHNNNNNNNNNRGGGDLSLVPRRRTIATPARSPARYDPSDAPPGARARARLTFGRARPPPFGGEEETARAAIDVSGHRARIIPSYARPYGLRIRRQSCVCRVSVCAYAAVHPKVRTVSASASTAEITDDAHAQHSHTREYLYTYYTNRRADAKRYCRVRHAGDGKKNASARALSLSRAPGRSRPFHALGAGRRFPERTTTTTAGTETATADDDTPAAPPDHVDRPLLHGAAPPSPSPLIV
ncbi:hypothetical protein ACI65C_006737 [Semiaphis heraclei]